MLVYMYLLSYMRLSSTCVRDPAIYHRRMPRTPSIGPVPRNYPGYPIMSAEIETGPSGEVRPGRIKITCKVIIFTRGDCHPD